MAIRVMIRRTLEYYNVGRDHFFQFFLYIDNYIYMYICTIIILYVYNCMYIRARTRALMKAIIINSVVIEKKCEY